MGSFAERKYDAECRHRPRGIARWSKDLENREQDFTLTIEASLA